ncbi:transducin/WD40 repeat-like superfamily protein [Wolffia australiana]
MEWESVLRLDLRHVGRGSKTLQPHAAAFHPVQGLIAVAIGTHIVEFDAFSGCKICSIEVGSPVVRMAYSPTSRHAVISILEDCTIRSCDFDTEQSFVLHSPEKRTEHVSSDAEVHLALTPLLPVVFFGFHRRMSVTAVGTIEGGRPPTKIKTDLKKPIVNLACHPRLPFLYVAYADGLIRAYNINTYAVLYTLQLDSTIKLVGAGAFAFHPTLEWIFVGDRSGALLAWDVSTERPNMIGITQVGSSPITSVSWITFLSLLVTVSRNGGLQVWKTRVITNPNKQPMLANFFELAAVESIDIMKILSFEDGGAIHPLPRIKNLAVHPKLNLAALLFVDITSGEDLKNRSGLTREARKQLFSVLQSARGSTAANLKERLLSLGSSGILADRRLQSQLQEQVSKGRGQLTMSDIARKAFLKSYFMDGHAKNDPISKLPLIAITEKGNELKDVPVCQPFHLELNFFNKERVLHYPVRAFYMDGVNLISYNLSSGADNIYRKVYTTNSGNIEYRPKNMIYSSKQHLFLILYQVCGISGSLHEVVLYWEHTDAQAVSNKGSAVKGRDAAFVGPKENQYAVLDEDKSGLSLYLIPSASVQQNSESEGELDVNSFSETRVGGDQGHLRFSFDGDVDHIFSTPLESTILYVISGDCLALANLLQPYSLSSDGGHYITTKSEGMKAVKLKANETVLQVQWQETLRGYVAGILTSERILIVSKDLDIISSSSSHFSRGVPLFRSLLWIGPALLFSSATIVCMLGWDNKVRPILSISMPYSVLLGALNDRLLFVTPTDINPRRKKSIEVRSCLVGLLEPLLIGFATMQQQFEQKVDLPEILYQITSRFDSLRITPRSLDVLAKGSPVCGDLAVSLSQAGPQFTQVLRCIYAIKALRFSTALSILKDEFLRSRDYPRCPPTSHLFHRFRQLGYACINYGQFDSAKETFEVIADYERMLDLFICHLNPSAMRILAQKLEEAGVDSELRRHCERILRVRSTGWTQGIFANFAAESMVPKGPEWGGGNWEIKTPTKIKDIPQWELATEVMPYMRTSENAIPSIVVDHIGVYLGVVKGRGRVAQVSEQSLVKAPENGRPEPPLSLSFKSRAPSGTSLSDQLAAIPPGSTEEQARAEAEFKKSLYGGSGDGGSSGEDEATSRTRKFQIRIRDKPAEAAVVDVDKIKEATKQLKLADVIPPPSRTRSLLVPPQDLPLMLQPASALTSTPVPDLFAGATMPPPPPSGPMVAGMGVTAGPIPEDFFENTISSVKLSATLAPVPVTSIPGLSPQEKVSPAANIGLPDGGVPPTGPEQPLPPPQSSSLESVGLPGGGVPPQNVQRSQASPLTIQPAVTSQPVDLSALMAPGSGGSGPAPPPKAVLPGQVPRGAAAAECFKTGVAHLEQNQLSDALSCFDEAFLALAKDLSRGVDVKAQATICAQYKIAVSLLQEMGRLQRVGGAGAVGAKEETARLSRHLASLPLQAKHRISCIRTAIKRNMEVQNYGYAKQMLELLCSRAPPEKQDELRSLADVCIRRGASDKSIDPLEDASLFCFATLARLSTIGHDRCHLCAARFSALASPACVVCGMGAIIRSDASPASTPFG